MAAQNQRNRTIDGQCLECLVNEFEEEFSPNRPGFETAHVPHA
jgi:hypothetical protein